MIRKLTFLLLLTMVAPTWASQLSKEEIETQNKIFRQWWERDLVWKFSELPTKGMVEKHRIPYAGHIYPDRSGGTSNVLRKYDRAFHGGRRLASSYEHQDIRMTRVSEVRSGPLGLLRRRVTETPEWAGHCNGWTAAAIRHAEPVNNVVRNGVVFSPADIKGLMAEVYTYTQTEYLGGTSSIVNPASLHVMMGNWIGLGTHPIAMDKTVGKEIWNYPIYAYTASTVERGSRQVEVKVNLGYIKDLNREYDEAPQNYEFLYFHYNLDLNSRGEIVGGSYYRDSNQIDMLWVPLKATQGGQTGNENGNPYLNVKQVLSLWRESAPLEKREKWYNIDPTDEDRIVLAEAEAEAEEPEVIVDDVNAAPVEADATDETDDTQPAEGQDIDGPVIESAVDNVPAVGRVEVQDAGESAADIARFFD